MRTSVDDDGLLDADEQDAEDVEEDDEVVSGLSELPSEKCLHLFRFTFILIAVSDPIR